MADVCGLNHLGSLASGFSLGLADERDWQEVRGQQEREVDLLFPHGPSLPGLR